MTNSGDEPSRRLSDALDAILHGGDPEPPTVIDEPIGDAATGDAEPDGWPRPRPYQLPDIVPATSDGPATGETEVVPQIVPGTTYVDAPVPAVSAPQRPPSPASAPASPPSASAAPASTPTSWGDHMKVNPGAPPAAGLREPGRQPRVRRVTRVVRHVDPWSVFKLALVFSLVGYLVVLTSGVLMWRVADSTGTLDNVERWFTQFGWETFELKGGEIFHNAWIIGLFCAVGLTGAAVLMATLFNLVSDIVGGIRVTVLEEEVVERTASSSRRYVVRRPPLGASGPGHAPAWDVDEPDPEPPPSAPKAETPAPDAATPSAPRATADWSVDDDDPVSPSST